MHDLRLDLGDLLLPRLFFADLVGAGQAVFRQLGDLFLVLGLDRLRRFPRFLGRRLGEVDDRVDDGLEMLVAEHHGLKHDLLGQLVRFGLDHHDRVAGAGHDEIKLALGHVVDRGVQHVVTLDIADARCADRPEERDA